MSRDRHIRDAHGGSLCGQVCGDWPAWWADVIEADEIYHKLEHNARTEAELEYARRR